MSGPIVKLLLVDDQDAVRERLARYLGADPYYYEVTDVPDFEEAIRTLEEKRGYFDVALVDEVLGEGPSGLDVVKYVKSKFPDIEVILFTGLGLKSGAEARLLGVFTYVAKPFNPDQLALTIHNAAERKRIRREHRYMEALVKASQALTQTPDLDEQLKIIWNFVREQLATSTCFVALYDSQNQILRFPLSYDRGKYAALPDLRLGADQANWGLAGTVIKAGQERVWSTRAQAENDLQALGLKMHSAVKDLPASGICLPLRTPDEILGALCVQSYKPNAFDDALLNAVRALGNQVAVAIENSRLVSETSQRALNLEKLQNLTVAINSTLDLKEVLIQTCQAAVELIGVDHSGMVVFEPDLSKGAVVAEYPMDQRTFGQTIPVQGVEAEEELVFHQKVLNIPDVESETRLGSVREILLRSEIHSIAVVPVVFNGKVIASFSLDAMHRPRAFSQDEIDICQRLANQVAVAIENARLIAQEQNAARKMKKHADRLRVLYEIGRELTSARNVDSIWELIARDVIRLVGARRSLLILVDTKAKRLIKAIGQGYPAEHLQGMTIEEVETGVSGWVLKTKETVLLEDAQSDPRNTGKALEKAKDFATAPLIVAPLLIKGDAIGTLTAVNAIGDPPFDEDDKDLIEMLAAQAAIAYDNARRMRELEQLQKAADAMAREAEWRAVLQQIAQSAMEVLESDYTLIWPYDAERKIFFPEDLVAQNVPDDLLEKFRKVEPEAGKTTDRVLEKGFVQIEDLDREKPEFLGESTREFLERLSVKSFMGIRLQVANEPIGVLYVDYKCVHGFGLEDRRILEHFANHAALTLKKARLLRQVNRARETARVVAEVTALGNLKDTLKEIVHGAIDVLGCNIVTLYTFDEKTQKFVHVEGAGYSNTSSWRKPEQVSHDSSLWRVIQLGEPYYHPAEKVSQDRLLQGGFVRSENVQSALGIQLRCEGERVGVMFIDYRAPHRFTQDEINDALQFANQAAVAIRNAQRHDEIIKHTEVLQGLYEAGKAITKSLSLDETLARITEQALHIIGPSCTQAGCFSHIALKEGNQLRFVAAQPKEMLGLLQSTFEIDLQASDRKGIVGRAVLTGQTLNVREVRSDPDYIPAIDETRSQLSVPLKLGDHIIGVLSIEHPLRDAFTSRDENNIKSLATQAAIAIANARQVDQIEAMRSAAETMVGATDAQEVLGQIAASSKRIMSCSSTAVWPYDNLRDIFIRDDLVFEGMPGETGQAFRQRDAQHGGIAYTILDNHVVEVEDLTSAKSEYPFMRQEVRELLLANRIRSFTGIALAVGKEKLGVLYINYDSPHQFTEDERKTLRTFANQAALALKNARFLEQQNKVRRAFRLVAELTVLGGLHTTLESIVKGAREVTTCDAVTLYTYDEERRKFGFPPHVTGALFSEKIREKGTVFEGSVVSRIRDMERIYVTNNSQIDPVVGGAFTAREGIKSTIGIPLIAGGHKVGVMFVNYRTQVHFNDDVLTDIQLFADQAAIAIRNAQLHGKTREGAEALRGLYEASKAITSTMRLDDTLSRIAEQALRIISTGPQSVQCFSHIALKEESKLRFVAAYPPEMIELLHGDSETDLKNGQRIGISGRAAETGDLQNIPNVLANPDYIPISEETRSQLSIPLKVGRQVIGVLSIEHPVPNAFSSEDTMNIELLAAQAAVAIRNSQQYEELQKAYQDVQSTKQILAARTAMAWTGMISSTWRHAIEKHAITIREQIELMRGDLAGLPKNGSIERRLEMMERLANQILRKPLTPPLSAEEVVESVHVNDFLHQRASQLWAHHPYKEIALETHLELENSCTVRASIEWLRRAFDILIDNAVDAMTGLPDTKITISSRRADNYAEILIGDTGRGIPSELLQRLFNERIEKPADAKGLGMGLLFAQMIVQTYGGEIRIGETGAVGTTMIISLPLET